MDFESVVFQNHILIVIAIPVFEFAVEYDFYILPEPVFNNFLIEIRFTPDWLVICRKRVPLAAKCRG